jgi:hypothetical protein
VVWDHFLRSRRAGFARLIYRFTGHRRRRRVVTGALATDEGDDDDDDYVHVDANGDDHDDDDDEDADAWLTATSSLCLTGAVTTAFASTSLLHSPDQSPRNLLTQGHHAAAVGVFVLPSMLLPFTNPSTSSGAATSAPTSATATRIFTLTGSRPVPAAAAAAAVGMTSVADLLTWQHFFAAMANPGSSPLKHSRTGVLASPTLSALPSATTGLVGGSTSDATYERLTGTLPQCLWPSSMRTWIHQLPGLRTKREVKVLSALPDWLPLFCQEWLALIDTQARWFAQAVRLDATVADADGTSLSSSKWTIAAMSRALVEMTLSDWLPLLRRWLQHYSALLLAATSNDMSTAPTVSSSIVDALRCVSANQVWAGLARVRTTLIRFVRDVIHLLLIHCPPEAVFAVATSLDEVVCSTSAADLSVSVSAATAAASLGVASTWSDASALPVALKILAAVMCPMAALSAQVIFFKKNFCFFFSPPCGFFTN